MKAAFLCVVVNKAATFAFARWGVPSQILVRPSARNLGSLEHSSSPRVSRVRLTRQQYKGAWRPACPGKSPPGRFHREGVPRPGIDALLHLFGFGDAVAEAAQLFVDSFTPSGGGAAAAAGTPLPSFPSEETSARAYDSTLRSARPACSASVALPPGTTRCPIGVSWKEAALFWKDVARRLHSTPLSASPPPPPLPAVAESAPSAKPAENRFVKDADGQTGLEGPAFSSLSHARAVAELALSAKSADSKEARAARSTASLFLKLRSSRQIVSPSPPTHTHFRRSCRSRRARSCRPPARHGARRTTCGVSTRSAHPTTTARPPWSTQRHSRRRRPKKGPSRWNTRTATPTPTGRHRSCAWLFIHVP